MEQIRTNHVNRLFQSTNFDNLQHVNLGKSRKPWRALGVSIPWYAADVDEIVRIYETEMIDPICDVVFVLIELGETPDDTFAWRLVCDLGADSDYARYFYENRAYETEADAVDGLRSYFLDGSHQFQTER